MRAAEAERAPLLKAHYSNDAAELDRLLQQISETTKADTK